MRTFLKLGAVVIAAVIVGVGVGSAHVISGHAGVAHPEGRLVAPNLALGPASSPALMTQAQVIEAVKNDHWAASLWNHPFTIEYGAYNDTQDGILTSAGPQPVGMVDVWKITFTGLNIPRPGGPGGAAAGVRPAPVTTLVIYVDDKHGKVLHATGF